MQQFHKRYNAAFVICLKEPISRQNDGMMATNTEEIIFKLLPKLQSTVLQLKDTSGFARMLAKVREQLTKVLLGKPKIIQ